MVTVCKHTKFEGMKTFAQNILLFLALPSFLMAQDPVIQTGEVLQCEKVFSASRDELVALWKKNKVSRYMVPVRYDVDVYEILYTSRYPNGNVVSTSGLLFVPVMPEKARRPLLMFNHGTQIRHERKVGMRAEQAICMGFAADGYVVAMPDYFGIGKGEGIHIYQHAESEAQANIDMIRALRKLEDSLHLRLNEQLFISGYSQGGHAAMATHKFIEECYAEEFKVTASAPMSGAYDMTGVQSRVMFEEYSHPAYLPYLLSGYNEVYRLFSDIRRIFKSPYDTLVKHFYDGKTRFDEINKRLPSVPAQMIHDDLVEQFRSNPNFSFLQVLRQNDVYDWRPQSPMMLCYCQADEQVDYRNSLVAYKAMKAKGSRHVYLTHAGKKFNHFKCALYSVLYTKFFFDSFRKGRKYGSRGPIVKRMILGVAKAFAD